MKFDNQDKDVIQIGDIKSNSVSIDTSNIDFIVTILSTNLYSNPIQSFIRETVSNAWDSHVEAGVTEPVIFELGEDTEGNYFCRVQDFGVGLSPERFDSIYRNIGSSTKRGDNNQIGGFGIGRFSALAYSDVVYITSNFEGKQYKYMMYKDGNRISIDLLHEKDTTERNGVEVKIPVKSEDLASFKIGLNQQLVYFENVYAVNSTKNNYLNHFDTEFNTFHIKKYENFIVNDLEPTKNMDIVLGKVRYPLSLPSLSKRYANGIINFPISLKFNIGDLEVTPNREQILYSQKNIAKIESVLDKALEEIDTIIKKEGTKDFTSVHEYANAIKQGKNVILLDRNPNKIVYIRSNNNLNYTFNGIKYSHTTFIQTYDKVMGLNLIGVTHEIYNGKLYSDAKKVSAHSIKINLPKFKIGNVASLSAVTKDYIRTLENYTYFIPTFTKRSLKKLAKSYLAELRRQANTNYSGYTYNYSLIKPVLANVLKNLSQMPVFTDKDVPQSFIAQRKADMAARRANYKNAGLDWSQHVSIGELELGQKGGIISVSVTKSLTDINKSNKGLVIYSEKGCERLRDFFIICKQYMKNIKVIEIAPTKIKFFKHMPNFIHINDFMSVQYRFMRRIATAKLIEDEIPFILKLGRIGNLNKISTKLADVVEKLHDYCEKHSPSYGYSNYDPKLTEEICKLCKDKNYYDEEMRALLYENMKMLKNSEFLLTFLDKNTIYHGDRIPERSINLAVDYILSRKLFRPDLEIVKKLRKETILNLKTNEDN